jgi:hypothetical protein
MVKKIHNLYFRVNCILQGSLVRITPLRKCHAIFFIISSIFILLFYQLASVARQALSMHGAHWVGHIESCIKKHKFWLHLEVAGIRFCLNQITLPISFKPNDVNPLSTFIIWHPRSRHDHTTSRKKRKTFTLNLRIVRWTSKILESRRCY